MSVNNDGYLESYVNLLNYINGINLKEHEILEEIANYNATHKLGNMQLAKIQKDFIVWVANLIQVKNYLEIGVFTGYSSTAMALSLPEDAKIIACDINLNFTKVAEYFWGKAGVINKIKLYLQPALITLDELIKNKFTNFFDLSLIDADKLLIPDYVDKCFELVRSKGIIVIDNTLSKGRVLNPKLSSSLSVKAISKFNLNLKNDKRFSSITLPMGDGLTLLLKS